MEKNDTIKLKELLVRNLSEEKGESTVVSFAQHWFTEGMNKGKLEGFDEGMHKGIDQGRNKGKLEAKLEAARNMLNHGMGIKVISEIIGLPTKELQNFLQKFS